MNTLPNISINKEKTSPYWMVSFIGADGKQKRRSTKVPVAGGLFEGENLTKAQAEKRALIVGAQIACRETQNYTSLDNTTVNDFLTRYLRSASKRLTIQSVRNIRSACTKFTTWLGKRADEPLRLVTRQDAKDFMEARREEVRCGSVVRDLGCLKAAFEDALDSEIITKNPFRKLAVPKDRGSEKHTKEAFTIEELQYIIDHFPAEWSSAVRCSYETFGQRLGDILALRWNQFDWETRTVNLTTQKTGTVLRQPMRDSFYTWARQKFEASGSDPNALLHPVLHAASSPSYEFTLLLRAHGIGVTGEKQAGSRQRLHSKTFHSIRATAATLLQAGGISQGVAMKLVGHSSESIHEVYIRPNDDLLREAAAVLPTFH